MKRRSEIVHDAGDRRVRSARISKELRAICYCEDDRITLVFVGHHDEAYTWVRGKCVGCNPVTGEIELSDAAQA